MTKQTLVLFLLTCSIVSGWILAKAQTPEQTSPAPTVTKAVAPSTYPAIARAAHAEGNEVVEVTINTKGDVVAAKGIQGHALLASTAVSAARRWTFAAVPEGSSERSAKLTFNFRVAANKEEAQIAFNPPYEITFAVAPGDIVNTINY